MAPQQTSINHCTVLQDAVGSLRPTIKRQTVNDYTTSISHFLHYMLFFCQDLFLLFLVMWQQQHHPKGDMLDQHSHR